MYLNATDNGTPTTLYSVPNSNADGKDIRLLGLMIEAAKIAEAEDYCYQYDRIAEMIGTWTRDELRDAGLLSREYSVRGTRRVSITVDIPYSFTGEFNDSDDARDADPDDFDELTMDDVREHIRYNGFDFTVDDTDVDSVEAE